KQTDPGYSIPAVLAAWCWPNGPATLNKPREGGNITRASGPPASMTGMLGASAAVTAVRRSWFSFQPVIVQAALDAAPVTGAAVPSRRCTEMLWTGGLPRHRGEPDRYRMIFSTSAHGMKMAGLCRAARLVGM